MSAFDDLFKAVNKQGIKTTSQTVGQPRTQTPLSDDKWAKFEAAVSAPKKRSGGGGIGGLLGKALGVLDLPRSIITSGVKEITDAFQGEGFNFGEFVDQSRNHYGFGDFIRDEGIDLGKWGNRAVGFIGDVALDPLTYAGGLGVYSRARGARGLIDDLAPLRVDLQKEVSGLSKRRITSANKAKLNSLENELNAVNTAINAAGRKGGSVSRARNALANLDTPQASKLIDDLGIQTGLRFRTPGTGPVLGKLTRGSESLARRRAKQLPDFTTQRLEKLGVEGEDLTDLIRRAGRGKKSDKGLNEVADSLPNEVREIVSRAARMPVEFTPRLAMPLGGKVSASIMQAPGIGMEKMATSRLGRSLKKAFVDEETQYLNKLRRGASEREITGLKKIRDTGFRRAAQQMVQSQDVNDILVSNFFNNAQKRGSGMSTRWADTRTRNTERFVTDIQQNVGRKVNNDLLGRVTELSPELADDIINGTLSPQRLEILQATFPTLAVEDIGYIIRSFDNIVRKPDLEFLGRPDLYGRSLDEVELGVRNALMEDFEAVLNDYGGYTTQKVSKKGKAIFQASNTSELEQVLEEGVPTATNRYQVKGRYVTKSNRARKNVPNSLFDDGTIRKGRKITVPRKDGTGEVSGTVKRSYAAQSNVPTFRTIKEVPDAMGGVKTTVVDERMANSKEFAKRKAYEEKLAKGEIAEEDLLEDALGRSVPDQIDQIYREAGWLDEGESMYERGFIEREQAYIADRATGIRQDAIENYAAKQGLIFNSSTARAYQDTIEGLAKDALIFSEEVAKLTPEQFANRMRQESLERMGIAIKGTKSDAEAEEAFENFITSLGPEGPAVRQGIDDAVKAGTDAFEESLGIQEEIETVIKKMRSTLKRDKGVDKYFEKNEGNFTVTNEGKFAIDSVRELTPIIDDLSKIITRQRLLENGTEKITKLADSLSQLDNSENTVQGLRAFVEELKDFQTHISDTLIPNARELAEDVMSKDRSVVALEEMLDAVKLAAGGLDASMKSAGFKPIKGLSKADNETLRIFTNKMAEIGELEDVLQLNLLSNKGENLPTMLKRLEDTSQKMVDEARKMWGSKAGSRLAAILAPEDIGVATPSKIRRNIGQSFNDLSDRFDSFSPVQTQVRQTTEIITPQMDEIIEAGFREVPNVPDPSTKQFGPWLEDTLRSTPTGQTTAWEDTELVNFSGLIQQYDTLHTPRKGTESINKLTSKLENNPIAQASFVAREGLSNAFDNAIGVMERNIEQLNLQKRALLRTPDTSPEVLADIDDAIEALSIKLQASIKGQEENMMFYQGLEGTNKRFEDAFNLNNYGGEFNVQDVTPQEMMDLYNSGGDQVWGGWTIKGDQRTFDQFKEGMLATQKMNDVREVGAFLRTYDQMHNWLKAQMVATPGFVLRNLMGGMANMWFADIPLSETLGAGKLLKQAYKEGRGDLEAGLTGLLAKNPKNQDLRNALDLVKLGAHGGGQASSTVDVNLGKSSWLDFVVGSKDAGAMNRKARIRLNPLDSGFALFAGVRHANTMAEGAMRLGTGLHAMRTGRNIDDAIGEIYKLHFDYGQLSKFEQSTAKRLIPFYTWTRNNLPLQMQMMAQNPKRFNRLMTVKRNMELGAEEDKNVADYMLEPYGFKLPFKISDSVSYFTPDLPLQDLIRMDPTAEGGKRALEQVVSGATPFIKAPIEFWAKKKVFAGIPYQDKPVNFPVALRKIPGLKEAAKALGFADQNRRGDWLINDKHLGFIENMLPFISRFRRFIPEDKKTQDGWLRTMLSSGAGLSVKINTPRLQRSEVIRRRIRRADERSKKRAWRNTIV